MLPAINLQRVTVTHKKERGKLEIFAAWSVLLPDGTELRGRTPLYRKVQLRVPVEMRQAIMTPQGGDAVWALVIIDVWESDGKRGERQAAGRAIARVVQERAVQALLGRAAQVAVPFLAVGLPLFKLFVARRRRPDLLAHGTFFVTPSGIAAPQAAADARDGEGASTGLSRWTLPGIGGKRPSADADFLVVGI